jgi:hypothetical protein
LSWGTDLAFPTVFECLEPIVSFGPGEFRLPEARRPRRRRYEDDAMWIDLDIKKLRANSIEDGGFNISARCSISFLRYPKRCVKVTYHDNPSHVRLINETFEEFDGREM